jgi:uncharacterized repeat protein (TIGR03837 family)
MRTLRQWDIFCRVVDNFGDAGVCWRLARRLARELGFDVRLWIDDLRVLRKLQPALGRGAPDIVDGVRVLEWNDSADFGAVADSDVVVEAFGCGLPARCVEAMAHSPKRVLWIVLEYLSAEAWVREHHGLPSPHPRLALERYFFFPGFGTGTGGLLRESGLLARREAFGHAQRDAFWRSIEQPATPRDADVVSVFAYDTAPLAELLRHWERSPRETVVAIPEGALAAAALNHVGASSVAAGGVLRRSGLEVRVIPWLPQPRYDELLWSCDINFVRGEDSFVRAQWAARPFVWHIYPQEEGAHAKKLQAFVDLYCEGLEADAAEALRGLMNAWNRVDAAAIAPAAAWDAAMAHRDTLRRHARGWAARIGVPGELAENLASFCSGKLK